MNTIKVYFSLTFQCPVSAAVLVLLVPPPLGLRAAGATEEEDSWRTVVCVNSQARKRLALLALLLPASQYNITSCHLVMMER